jgi:hypothetical protein
MEQLCTFLHVLAVRPTIIVQFHHSGNFFSSPRISFSVLFYCLVQQSVNKVSNSFATYSTTKKAILHKFECLTVQQSTNLAQTE